MKQNCIIARLDNPDIAQLFEIDTAKNLLTNLRVLCTKNPDTLKFFVPNALFQDILIGNSIALNAEAYDEEKRKLFSVEPLIELHDQLNLVNRTASNKGIINEIRIKVDGYTLPNPNLSLIPLSTSNLAQIQKDYRMRDEEFGSYDEHNEGSKGKQATASDQYNDESHFRDRDPVKPDSDRKKVKLIIPIVFAIILVIIFLVVVLSRDTSVSKVLDAIDQGNYKEAVEIYNDRIDGHESKEAEVRSLFSDAVQKLRERYLAGESTFKETCEVLQTLSQIRNAELSGAANKALLDVQLQESSLALYTKGNDLLDSHDYYGAIETFLGIDESSVYYGDAKEKISECVHQLVSQDSDIETKDSCINALKGIDSVLELLPDNPELQSYKLHLVEIRDNFTRSAAIELADVKMEAGDFKNALASIDSALKEIKDDPELLRKRVACENSIRDHFTSMIDQHIEKNDYPSAFSELKTALSILPKDTTFESKQEECQQLYENYITTLVQEKISLGEFEAAVSIISDAKKVYSCTAFDTLFSETEAEQLRVIEEMKTRNVEAVHFVTYSGSIENEDDVDTYTLLASEDGYYRFDFSEIRRGFKTYIQIYGKDDYIISSDHHLSNGAGITCKLSKGTEYTLKVGGYGLGTYTLTIGQPKPSIDISPNEIINDSIEYYDQTNIYYFTPELTGVYRFTFSNIVSGFKLRIYIYDSLGYLVDSSSGLSNNDGATFFLGAGETYKIEVDQENNFGSYQLSVGKQLPTEDISGKTTVQGEIHFVDQENLYTYTASSTGEYRFTVKDTMRGFQIELTIRDDLGYYVAGDSSLGKDEYISAELTGGKTYTIYVSQDSSLGTYRIQIARE